MIRRKTVRIQEIAEIANVSVGTVDRALHSRGNVAQKTKDNIFKIALQLGYDVPTVITSEKIIGLLLPDPKSNSYWQIPLDGIIKASEFFISNGLKVRYFFYNYNDAKDFLIKGLELIDNQLDGVILHPKFLNETYRLISVIEQKKIKFAFLDTQIPDIYPNYFVGQNILNGGALVGRITKLSVRYNEKILIINPFEGDRVSVSYQRERALINFLSDQNIDSSRIDVLDFLIGNDKGNVFELKKLNDYRVIYITNSKISLVINEMDKESYVKNDLVIIGHDITEENKKLLQDDKIDFIIDQAGSNQGYEVLKGMWKFLNSKQEKTSKKLLSPILFTKENINN